MRLNIRAMNKETEYPLYTEIYNAAYPEYPETVEETKFWDDNRNPDHYQERFIAELDGEPVGASVFGHMSWMHHPQKFFMELFVKPEHQGKGIGKALYNHVFETLEPQEPIAIRTFAREDYKRGMKFITDRGFDEDMRSWESRLDLETFDLEEYGDFMAPMREQEIVFKTLDEIKSDDNWQQRLYETYVELDSDVPSPDTFTPKPFDIWIKTELGNPNLIPETFLLATHNGEYIGASALWKLSAEPGMDNGLTGVKRDYRRRGIALAMKLKNIETAKRLGYPSIKTYNEANNRAMLSINERLGFVKQPAWITFIKKLKEEPAEQKETAVMAEK